MPASAAAVLMRDRLRRRGPALPGRMRWERGLARRGCRARLVRRGGRARLGPVTVDVHADPPARHDRAEALHGGRVRQQHMVHAVPGDRLRAGAARGRLPPDRLHTASGPALPGGMCAQRAMRSSHSKVATSLLRAVVPGAGDTPRLRAAGLVGPCGNPACTPPPRCTQRSGPSGGRAAPDPEGRARAGRWRCPGSRTTTALHGAAGARQRTARQLLNGR